MKITTFLLLISILSVSAATNAQQITLKIRGASLQDVLTDISQQTGYDVFCSNDLLLKARPVTIDLKNTPLAEAMNTILAGQALTFKMEDKTIIIKEKETSFLDNLKEKVKELIANIDVRGRVTDESDLPVPGATVTVKGTGNVTATDVNGSFYLHNVAADAVIVITSVGFDKQELPAKTEMGTIRMKTAESKLDEVQVIAYGQQTQRLSVGNVTTISAKTISEQPTSNTLLALEGQVPGLNIVQTNGFANGGVTVRVQGLNSIAHGNEPLYVIDGVPYPSQLLATPGVTLLGSTLSFIDPSSIESISVLKDADATSIYGSRAANGAILITTKKGKAGAMKVDIDLQQGMGKVPHFVDLMNTQQYLQMRTQAYQQDGLPVPSLSTTPTDRAWDINGFWDQSRNTNWQKVLLGGTDHYSDYNASISAGSPNVQYLVGSTFHRETSVFPGDFADTRGGVHFNLNATSNNEKFHLSLTSNYLFDNNSLPLGDPTQVSLNLAPDAPPLYNPDGSVNWALTPSGANSWTNPVAANFLPTSSTKTKNLITSLNLGYQLAAGLSLSLNLGYNNLSSYILGEVPLTYNAPPVRPFSNRTATYTNSDINSWIAEPQLTYSKVIAKGKLTALMGLTIDQMNSTSQLINGVGYNSDAVLANIAAAATLTPGASVNSVYRYNAGFARLNYIWDNKYIVNLTGRRDGSSRFGAANQFNEFWSVAGGWIFTENPSIRKALPWLSFGKLHASYGTTGNDQIGDYQYLNTYTPVSVNTAYQGVAALLPNGFANPYLEWELTRKFSAGIDLGFLNDRILLTAAYSDNRSSNELIQYPLPQFTGATSVLQNLPATFRNYDWEFTATSVNIRNKSFTWKTTANLTIPRNVLVSFPGLESSSYATTFFVGRPFISVTRVYHFLGVNPTTGVYQFAGQNGPTSTPNAATDLSVFEDNSPKAYGAVQNSFSYKNFQLDFTLQFVKQNGVQYDYGNTAPPGYPNYNQPTSVLNNFWTTPGPNASIQRYSSTLNYYTAFQDIKLSDAYYGDDSYLRLKNVSLSWTMPEKWSNKLEIKNLRLYLQGQNLLTFTKYKGFDPETLSGPFATYLPTLRVIVFGIKVGL